MRLRPGLTRRAALQLGGAAVAASALPPWAWAAGKTGLHGLSIFGDLKYPADFKQFDDVNGAAPKGGRMNFQPPNWAYNQSPQTFNTLNSFVLKGDSPPRMEMTFDTLMTRASDEPDAIYGLVAESVDVSDDLSTYTFHLRPDARFNDGTPLTADDVAFSLMLIKEQGHPNISEPMQPMVKAEALDRVMMAEQYVIPSYTYLPDRIAYWDRFGHPDPYPRFTEGFPTVWWWDAAKAAKTGGGN